MISDLQTELPLAPDAPAAEDVERFVEFLRTQKRWMTAAKLIPALGLPEGEKGRRELRLWANASDGRVISGQKGYRHIETATQREIKRASAWLFHQAKEMDARARSILRRAHKNL